MTRALSALPIGNPAPCRGPGATFAVRRLLAVLVLTMAAAWGAPLERDLGHGLHYYRVHALPADLPARPGTSPAGPCVVDVRYVHAGGDAAAAFLAWINFYANARNPVFVLANADTSADLVRPLTREPRAAGVVVVGVPARNFEPHVAVPGSPAGERRAYDALEHGTTIAALLTDNPNKARNDEASLSKDRLAEASADAADDALAVRSPAPPPVDAALQRAVHLHRALVALKRL